MKKPAIEPNCMSCSTLDRSCKFLQMSGAVEDGILIQTNSVLNEQTNKGGTEQLCLALAHRSRRTLMIDRFDRASFGVSRTFSLMDSPESTEQRPATKPAAVESASSASSSPAPASPGADDDCGICLSPLSGSFRGATPGSLTTDSRAKRALAL